MSVLRIIDRSFPLVFLALILLILSGCGIGTTEETPEPAEQSEIEVIYTESENPKTEAAPVLLYMGQASIRIVTPEDKVIYIDPYAGGAYDLPADLILVTHDHFDHSALDRVKERSEDCVVITQVEALENGEHQTFVFPFVTVEAVEAGYNRWHDVRECVGYVLTFTNGKSVYVSGDTSTTNQMSEMSSMEIDYAFYCCDGVYNMGIKEAVRCAEMVGAKHNIPYHNSTSNRGEMFDLELAEQFDAENRLIVLPGEEIEIQ